MAKHGLTDEQLEKLTDEEREGLLDEDLVDDEDDNEGEADASTGGDGQSEALATAGDGDGDAGAEDDGATAGDGTEITAGDDATATAETEDDASGASDTDGLDDRTPSWRLPVEKLEQQKGFETRLDDLAKQFDEGELTAEEFRAQQKAIEAEKRVLDREIDRAEINKANAIEKWTGETVPGFMKANPQYEGALLRDMLDKEVRSLQARAANPLDPKILKKAHENLTAQLTAALGGKPTPTPNPKPGRQQKREIPPTLGGVPAANIEDTADGSQFAYLDRLMEKDSIAFEAALKKLPPHLADQYMQR